MPPKAGNVNALQHGLRSDRPFGIVPGTLGKGFGRIVRRIGEFKTAIEAAVMANRSEITLADACLIQTCLRWERHAQCAQKWLRDNPDLPPADKLNFSREIARASSERDKALANLGLPRGNEQPDPWKAMDLLPPEPATSEAAVSVSVAQESNGTASPEVQP